MAQVKDIPYTPGKTVLGYATVRVLKSMPVDARKLCIAHPGRHVVEFNGISYTVHTVNVAMAFCKAHGYTGRAGGWIYSPGGIAVAHGYLAFYTRHMIRISAWLCTE